LCKPHKPVVSRPFAERVQGLRFGDAHGEGGVVHGYGWDCMRQHNISAARTVRKPTTQAKRRRDAFALAIAAAAAVTATALPARGAIKTWTAAGSGNWSTAASWNGGTVPAVTGDTVNITDVAAGVKTVTFDAAATTTSMAALNVGGTTNTFTGQMTLQFPLGSVKTVAVTGITTIGGSSTAAGAKGTILQDGATFNNTGTLNIGGVTQGAYSLTAGALTSAMENIGNAGIGTMTQTGGTHTVSTALILAPDAAATGTYTLNGGSLSAVNETVGSLGIGTFTQAGGTNAVNGAGATDSLAIATQAGSFSQYTLNSGNVNVTAVGGVVVGKAGNGTITQNGGTFTIGAGRDMSIGAATGGVGSYFMTGGTLSAGGNVYVGGTSTAAAAAGSLFISGGASATISGTLKIWNANGSSLTLSNGTLNVGTLDLSGNSSTFTWNVGTLNVTGASGLTIGGTGPLPANQLLGAGQNLSVTNVTTFAPGASLNMNGGSFTTSSLSAGAGTIIYNAGSVSLTGSGLLIDPSGPLGAAVTIPAGSAISASGALNNAGTVTLNGGTIGGGSLLTNTGALTGTGVVNGSGGISNPGLISLVGGNLTIAKSGVFQNEASGIIRMDLGRQLQLNGGNLSNLGILDLAGGGTVNSTSGASIINAADGMITGAGTVSVPLQNAGTLAVPTGTLTVTTAFANTGTIRLGAVSSKLTVGGAGLTNSAGGSLQGIGRLSATLNNAGYVEAVGGTLQLAGATNNNAGGVLAAGSGNEIYITGTPGPNLGGISLTGGTLHTNSQPLTNSATGVISGFGTIRTGGTGLSNSGQLQLSGGSTSVYGAVTSTNGSKIIVTGGATATFFDPVSMNTGSEFRVSTASTAVFFGAVTGGATFTGTGTKDFEAGMSALSSALVSSGSTIVQQGASLTAAAIQENVLQVNGNVSIAPNGTSAGTSKVSSLTVASGAKLDLANNKLIVTGGPVGSWNGSAYTGVAGQIASGRNGGNWGGSGIVTSMASGNLTTLGIATAQQAGRAGGNFGGLPVSASDALVMYTYGGDANLDGKINVDDYTRIDFNVPLGASGWYNGDFNYDGKINVDDYTIIDFNVGIQGAQFPAGSSVDGELSGVSAVPEPASLSIFGLAAASALGRRRRQSISR
jgi:hypothetical protein